MSLYIRPLCQTLSKALEMSKKIPQAFLPFFKALLIFCVKNSRLSPAPLFSRKPDCWLEMRFFLYMKEYSLVLINLSTSLPRQLVRLIGLYFSGSLHMPSFFGIMRIFASFHVLGIPVLMALFARQYKNVRVYSIGKFFSNRL